MLVYMKHCCYTGQFHTALQSSHTSPSVPLTLSSALVCLSGGRRVEKYCLLPSWLTQRSSLPHSEIVSELRSHVPLKRSECDREYYGIGCSWKAHVGLMYQDWYVRQDEYSEYGVTWSISMDSGRADCVTAVMICVDTQLPCQRCTHSSCVPLSLRPVLSSN